ncbi:MAG: protein translocase subunit SecF [Candidatus Dormibacteraceae bacterium]
MSEMSDVSPGRQTADIAPEASPAVEAQPAPRVRKLNIIGRRNVFFFISLIIIIPGIFSMATRGFLLGIDFAGGTEFTLAFANKPAVTQVEQAVASETIHGQSINGSVIQTDQGVFIIRARPMLPAEQKVVEDDLAGKLGTTVDVKQVLEVGPTIAGEAIQFALLAVVLASVAILFLLAIRFHNLPGGWRAGFQFGGSALAALLHDVFLLTGIFSIMGRYLGWRIGEIDSFFVVAVLTVVGFSVHDTIVVFDRIRENLRVSQRLSFEQVVNLSIMQTAARSIITSFTVVLVLVAILAAGGSTQKGLALALLIGIVSGTYSSIFNAAPLLVVWRKFQPIR